MEKETLKTYMVNLFLDDAEYIKEYCYKNKLSRSNIIREAVRDVVNKLKEKEVSNG